MNTKKDTMTHKEKAQDSFADFINELATQNQPTCNLENPEECEACGS